MMKYKCKLCGITSSLRCDIERHTCPKRISPISSNESSNSLFLSTIVAFELMPENSSSSSVSDSSSSSDSTYSGDGGDSGGGGSSDSF